jgi:hypothetical protein
MPVANTVPTRSLFAAGLLGALAPCRQGSHLGPLSDTERFDEWGEPWTGTGVCEECGSHIHHSQLRKVAA